MAPQFGRVIFCLYICRAFIMHTRVCTTNDLFKTNYYYGPRFTREQRPL